MGRMENPGALAGATGAGNLELAFKSVKYRLRAERATTLRMALADCDPTDAALIPWSALDAFHAEGFPVSPMFGLMSYATEWADGVTENERKAYQLVSLLMALRLQMPRLLIADDVGIGKRIEAGLILRELMDREEVNGFSVLCPPHLVEQLKSLHGGVLSVPTSGRSAGCECH